MTQSARVDLRNCSVDHLGELMRVEEESFPPVDRYSAWFLHALCTRCQETSFVAEYGGEVVGYVIACVESGKGHIVTIAVRPKYRRRGFGRLLLCKALIALSERGVKSAFLEVRTSNLPAISLYEKFNFRVKGRLKSYYLDGEDAYLMELEELRVEDFLRLCAFNDNTPIATLHRSIDEAPG